MRYWAYINNVVAGPFEEEHLHETPGFTPETLISPEFPPDGTNPDWKPASSIKLNKASADAGAVNVVLPEINIAAKPAETVSAPTEAAADPFAQLFNSAPQASEPAEAAAPAQAEVNPPAAEAEIPASSGTAAASTEEPAAAQPSEDPFAQLFGAVENQPKSDADIKPAESSVDPMTLTQIERNVAALSTPAASDSLGGKIDEINKNIGDIDVMLKSMPKPDQDIFAGAAQPESADQPAAAVESQPQPDIAEQIQPEAAITNPPAAETNPPQEAVSPASSATVPPMAATNPPASASSPASGTTPPMSATNPPMSGTNPPQGMPYQQPGMMPQGMPYQQPGMMPQGMPYQQPGMMPQGMPYQQPGMMPQGMPYAQPGMMPPQWQPPVYQPAQSPEMTQQMLQMMNIIAALQQDIRNLQQEKTAALAKLAEQHSKQKAKPKSDAFGFGGGEDSFDSGNSGFGGDSSPDFESGPGFASESQSFGETSAHEPAAAVTAEPEPVTNSDTESILPSDDVKPEPAPAAEQSSPFKIPVPEPQPDAGSEPKIESSFRLQPATEPEMAKPATISVALPAAEDSFRFQNRNTPNSMDTLASASAPGETKITITQVNRGRGGAGKKIVKLLITLGLIVVISLLALVMLAKFKILPQKLNPLSMLVKPAEVVQPVPAPADVNMDEITAQVKGYQLPSGKTLLDTVKGVSKANETEITWNFGHVESSTAAVWAVDVTVPPSAPTSEPVVYKFEYRSEEKALNPVNTDAVKLLETESAPAEPAKPQETKPDAGKKAPEEPKKAAPAKAAPAKK